MGSTNSSFSAQAERAQAFQDQLSDTAVQQNKSHLRAPFEKPSNTFTPLATTFSPTRRTNVAVPSSSRPDHPDYLGQIINANNTVNINVGFPSPDSKSQNVKDSEQPQDHQVPQLPQTGLATPILSTLHRVTENAVSSNVARMKCHCQRRALRAKRMLLFTFVIVIMMIMSVSITMRWRHDRELTLSESNRWLYEAQVANSSFKISSVDMTPYGCMRHELTAQEHLHIPGALLNDLKACSQHGMARDSSNETVNLEALMSRTQSTLQRIDSVHSLGVRIRDGFILSQRKLTFHYEKLSSDIADCDHIVSSILSIICRPKIWLRALSREKPCSVSWYRNPLPNDRPRIFLQALHQDIKHISDQADNIRQAIIEIAAGWNGLGRGFESTWMSRFRFRSTCEEHILHRQSKTVLAMARFSTRAMQACDRWINDINDTRLAIDGTLGGKVPLSRVMELWPAIRNLTNSFPHILQGLESA